MNNLTKILIIFSSREGQTHKIASYIASHICKNMECELIDILSLTNIDWSQYERILLGGSIHYGHFHPALEKFIKRYLVELQQRPSGFFCVNLSARKADKATPLTNSYMRKFLQKSPWQPDCCAVFAGALRYPQYRWLDRVMIQLIMRITGGETDTRKEIEYTDWQQVGNFADKIVQLEGKNG